MSIGGLGVFEIVVNVLQAEQLIRLNVPVFLAAMVCDDGSTAATARYGEADKLSVILSILIRCFDVSNSCKPRQVGEIRSSLLSLLNRTF